MDMGVYLSDIVKVSVWYFLYPSKFRISLPLEPSPNPHLCIGQLLVLIEEDIHVKLGFQVSKASK